MSPEKRAIRNLKKKLADAEPKERVAIDRMIAGLNGARANRKEEHAYAFMKRAMKLEHDALAEAAGLA